LLRACIDQRAVIIHDRLLLYWQVLAHPSRRWPWGFPGNAGSFQDTLADAVGNALPLAGDAIVPRFGSNWKLCVYAGRLLVFSSGLPGCGTGKGGAGAVSAPLALMHHNIMCATAVCVALLLRTG
jgi:hypothetical protein